MKFIILYLYTYTYNRTTSILLHKQNSSITIQELIAMETKQMYGIYKKVNIVFYLAFENTHPILN